MLILVESEHINTNFEPCGIVYSVLAEAATEYCMIVRTDCFVCEVISDLA